MSDSPSLNPLAVKCPTDRCKCVVLQSKTATLVQRKPRKKLPEIASDLFKSPDIPEVVKRMMSTPKSDEKPKDDYYWMVTDIMAFDNVGVSRIVDGIKYLSCADCDLAPIGYHDTAITSADDKMEYLIAID
ncbi:hypothetical protein GGI03_006445, partial [Coemansia sp. RSA 2337]